MSERQANAAAGGPLPDEFNERLLFRRTQMTATPVTYLQLERVEELLHLDLDAIDESVEALLRCIRTHIVEALIADPEIAKTGLSRHDLKVVVADAHYACVDEIIRHGFYPPLRRE
jgi:hypothetical protein